ncbi:MAG: hypothetical protein ABL984_12865 [Pyrinomonadaceae bacterium]
MEDRPRTVEEIENLRTLARKAWKVGWAIFALGTLLLVALYITKESSRVGFIAAAFFLSMSIWILFASKLIEKRNPLPKD